MKPQYVTQLLIMCLSLVSVNNIFGSEEDSKTTVEMLSNSQLKSRIKSLQTQLDNLGGSPLMTAVVKEDTDTVRSLLATDSTDVNFTELGLNPLLSSVAKGNEEITNLLLGHPRIEVNQGSSGWTALHFAAWRGKDNLVALLLKHPKIQVNPVVDEFNATPLLLAAWDGRETATQLLIEDERVDVNKAMIDGKTPLHCAIEEGVEGIVKLLKNHRKIAINQTMVNDVTPLLFSTFEEKPEITRLLLSHPDTEINQVSDEGFTPLFVASASKGDETTTRLLLGDSRIIVNQPIVVNQAFDHGSVLHCTIIADRVGTTCLLLDHPQINIEMTDNNGFTPLYWAATMGHKTLATLLIHYGAQNVIDKKGKLCLDVAKDDATREVMLHTWSTLKERSIQREAEDRKLEEDEETTKGVDASSQTKLTGADHNQQVRQWEETLQQKDAQFEQAQQELTQLTALLKERRNSSDKKNVALQQLKNQLKQAQQEEKRLARLLEEQRASHQVKEDELKQTQEQLNQARQEITRLRHEVTSKSSSPSVSINLSQIHHGTDQSQSREESYLVENLEGDIQPDRTEIGINKGKVSRDTFKKSVNNSQCCNCNNWFVRLLCCHHCCEQYKDSCNDLQLKLGISPG